MKVQNKNHKSPKAWLAEIAEAYIDALETLPFAYLTGAHFTQKDIFQLAPVTGLKYRGIENSK